MGMLKRFMNMNLGGNDPGKNYVAKPKDSSLESYLHEAFKLLELRFSSFDHDGAQMLMYRELEHDLSMQGFLDSDRLAGMFKRVDFDGNGTLDFSEFLALLYLFSCDQGHLTVFFRHPTNANLIKTAFDVMEKAMVKYDADRSRKLSISELDAFFREQMPNAVTSGVYKHVVDQVYPPQVRMGYELSFPSFMHMLYIVSSKLPGNSIKGTFAHKPTMGGNSSFRTGRGEQSALWQSLRHAFKILEADFKSFDRDNDDHVDYTEITMGIPPSTTNHERLDILSRLEHAFKAVDVDGSRTLDFYEYMYLGFMMTQRGAYHDLVQSSQGSAQVKKCFIDIHTHYRHFDEDGNMRLTWDELQKLFVALFGELHPRLPEVFAKVKYQSSATQGRDAVDVVRFMKLLYMLICPDGRYGKGHVPKLHKKPSLMNLISVASVQQASQRPQRFRDVQVHKFVKGKLLGQGGQGTVHLGTYEGVKCAGKTFLGAPDDTLVKEILDEVRFFMAIDHPNCHYLLGAKTSLDHGGPMELTEVCDNGSLFDMYCQRGKRFDPPTAWRLGKECALGLEAIHGIGYMHRDIKSLNVFVTHDMVAKVADFGMCTNVSTSTEGCGTIQWAAPEVLVNVYGGRQSYDRSCDVFSYAVLLWEIFEQKVPYSETGLDQMALGKEILGKGIRPPFSHKTPPSVAKLIHACWSKDARSRPSFSQIVHTFESFKKDCQDSGPPPPYAPPAYQPPAPGVQHGHGHRSGAVHM